MGLPPDEQQPPPGATIVNSPSNVLFNHVSSCTQRHVDVDVDTHADTIKGVSQPEGEVVTARCRSDCSLELQRRGHDHSHNAPVEQRLRG
jgi:hypothetical protein